MTLQELLSPEHIVLPLEGATLREALDQMLDRLEQRGLVRDASAIRRLLAETRMRDVVALGPDVVLPHFRTDAVAGLTMAIGVAREPIRVADAPGLEPRIVILILAPREAATLYLQTVSTITRMLEEPGVVERLAAATTPAEIIAMPELAAARIQPRLTVGHIMSHRVWSVSPDQSAREAVDLMVRRRVAALPVVGEKAEVLGIVTDRELMSALLPQIPRAGDEAGSPGRATALRETRVRDIMSRSVLCIAEEMGLNEVATLMINKDVEQVPVVSDGRLVGMLTRSDIIRKLFGR
ncbi:MAG TPA: CBS domain-containing protein [Longimicrobiales bacterium]|nr:CBS domain-containing protein [Longimicrobiales bacterium]